MSTTMFRVKARDEQVARDCDNAPACGVSPDDHDTRTDDERSSTSVRPPIRLVIRPRPARRRAA